MKFKATFTPNDPYWSYQWGPQKIEADWAWNTTIGNRSVIVAVVDTGIDYTHPDLARNYVPLGYDWVNMDADPLDDFDHGTHCAGIIAATIYNSIGIAGLAQVRIMAGKVLDSSGWGYDDWVASGIMHAPESFNVTLYHSPLMNESIPTEPHPGNSMWIEPSIICLSGLREHHRFNVTIWINFTSIELGNEIGAWQFVIVYDKAYLNATKVGYTAGTMSQWFKEVGVAATMPLSPDLRSFNETHNRILHGEVWMDGPKAPEGSYGSLSWIEFELTNIPYAPFTGYLQFITTGVKRCKLLNENREDVTVNSISSQAHTHSTRHQLLRFMDLLEFKKSLTYPQIHAQS